eukprot:ANDGO_00975.mRNA.1 Postreplication repair E3 ubiquitin-protein ligase rad18
MCAAMEAVQSIVECPICHETVKTALAVYPCMHVFCALCIRRALAEASAAHPECPVCRSRTSHHQLVPVKMVDEILAQLRTLSYVPCPMCGKKFDKSRIEQHAAECTGPTQSFGIGAMLGGGSNHGAAGNSVVAKKLPNMVYSIMNEKQLRKLLSDHCVPAGGNREDMARRHREFVMLYNAAADAGRPRSFQDCANEVVNLERSRAKKPRLDQEISAAYGVSALSCMTPAPATTSHRAENSSNDVTTEKAIQVSTDWRILYSTAVNAPFYFHVPSKTGSFERPAELQDFRLPHDGAT